MTTIVAGLEGVIAGESEICFIDGHEGVLSYRGYNIHTLAQNAKFEEVIFLLWNGRLPARSELDGLKQELVRNRPIPGQVHDFLAASRQAAPMDVLRTAVSMLSLTDPKAGDMSPAANQEKAKKLMAQTATIVTTFERLRKSKPVLDGDPRLSFAANFLYTLTGNRPDEVMEHAFDVALTLHADHELNASTFAARVTAATLSDIYSSITSAIGALKGPLHGGANQEVIQILLSVGSPEEGARRVREMLARKEKVPGFGHRVYRTDDPRATHLR
ncbi:MAG: citrate synthase, partial [Acidobacteria bacterium]|nr:citrate synthase [Acidobacteriota bacterium]